MYKPCTDWQYFVYLPSVTLTGCQLFPDYTVGSDEYNHWKKKSYSWIPVHGAVWWNLLRLRRGGVGKGRKHGMSVEGREKKQQSKEHEGRGEEGRGEERKWEGGGGGIPDRIVCVRAVWSNSLSFSTGRNYFLVAYKFFSKIPHSHRACHHQILADFF